MPSAGALRAALSPASWSHRAALESPAGSPERARTPAWRSSGERRRRRSAPTSASSAGPGPSRPRPSRPPLPCGPEPRRPHTGSRSHSRAHTCARPASPAPRSSSRLRSVLLLLVRVPRTPRPAICHQLALHWRGARSRGEGGGVGGEGRGGNCREPSPRAAAGAAAAGSSLGPLRLHVPDTGSAADPPAAAGGPASGTRRARRAGPRAGRGGRRRVPLFPAPLRGQAAHPGREVPHRAAEAAQARGSGRAQGQSRRGQRGSRAFPAGPEGADRRLSLFFFGDRTTRGGVSRRQKDEAG